MVKEVKNLTNIRLTESNTDGIWLHFEVGEYAAGVALSTLLTRDGHIVDKTIQAWAREQLDRPEPLPPAPANEFLKEGDEKRTIAPGTRPSSPVDGGY